MPVIDIPKAVQKEAHNSIPIDKTYLLTSRFKHYELGISLFDTEHLEIFKLSEKCRADVLSYADTEKSFDALLKSLMVHFRHEEDFMEDNNFPYAQAHKFNHMEILSEINNLMRVKIPRFRYTKKIEEILKVLEQIAITHIDHYDLQLKTYLDNLPKASIVERKY